jgi:hypothetical protein
MPQVNMHEAKTRLSRQVEAIESGRESQVIISSPRYEAETELLKYTHSPGPTQKLPQYRPHGAEGDPV